MKTHSDLFNKIISAENLFNGWNEFKRGKRNKPDVQTFEKSLEDNLFNLHYQLKTKTYHHSDYTSFFITDPKLRMIHRAIVADRVVHHAVYRILYRIFDKGFIFDSYSCRLDKGTHKAVSRFEYFARKVSKNYTFPCFVLKCDIKKFFASVNQNTLLDLIKKRIENQEVIWLASEIISSFNPERKRVECGIPIGNLTSQLFANIYLNELDQFIKHKLKIKFYLRYCDDFVVLNQNQDFLRNLISPINKFLRIRLKLSLHPNKIEIRKIKQGIDFLGYIILPHYRALRTKTKRRMLKRVNQNNLASYLGLLKHCNGHGLKQKIIKMAN